MCGFVGTIVPRTGDLLRHRGPDGNGSSSKASLPWCHANLEMTRLAIIDRRHLAVPFDFRKSLGIVLAWNGECYNHKELRAELSNGTPWETDCDAEVVARAWRRWGPGMLDCMNGMWGLALIDELKSEVFLARDRAGEKPLYYAPMGNGLAFASEIKALPIRLLKRVCEDYAVFELDCLQETMYEGVCRLGPGQYIHFCRGSMAYDLTTWWVLSDSGSEVRGEGDYQDTVAELEALLIDAVRIRTPSDLRVGVQISGGLDSAIIQAAFRGPDKSRSAYTVTFPDDGVDNLALARLAARETTPVAFTKDDLLGVLSDVAYHLDGPGTWTAVCQWIMCQKMAADGCVVTLSGEGADELFGGYGRYRLLYWLERAKADARLAEYGYAFGRLHGSDQEILGRLLNRGGEQTKARAETIAQIYGLGLGLLKGAMRIDFYTTMQYLLRQADAMAAAHSLENRAVLFDHRIMALAAEIPLAWKVTADRSKAILCDVAHRLGVDPKIIWQTTKRGLAVPRSWWGTEGSWDRGSFRDAIFSAWSDRPHDSLAALLK